MTKEITKAFILQQLEDKFGLRELEPEKFRFGESVVPTYDIGSHVREWDVLYTTKSVTSATFFTFFEVPQTERWYLRGYNVVFMATGAYKVSGIYLDRGGNTFIIYLDLKEGQTVSYAVNLPTVAVLNPGNALRILIDDYTSTADLRLYIDVQKETIR